MAASITKILRLEYSVNMGPRRGEERISYFTGFGRKMLIYRGKDVRVLGNSAWIVAKRKINGKVLMDCKFCRYMLEPEDQIIIGHEKVYKKYEELTAHERFLPRVGMEA